MHGLEAESKVNARHEVSIGSCPSVLYYRTDVDAIENEFVRAFEMSSEHIIIFAVLNARGNCKGQVVDG